MPHQANNHEHENAQFFENDYDAAAFLYERMKAANLKTEKGKHFNEQNKINLDFVVQGLNPNEAAAFIRKACHNNFLKKKDTDSEQAYQTARKEIKRYLPNNTHESVSFIFNRAVWEMGTERAFFTAHELKNKIKDNIKLRTPDLYARYDLENNKEKLKQICELIYTVGRIDNGINNSIITANHDDFYYKNEDPKGKEYLNTDEDEDIKERFQDAPRSAYTLLQFGNNPNYYTTQRNMNLETFLMETLNDTKGMNHAISQARTEHYLQEYNAQQEYPLSDEQLAAVRAAARHNSRAHVIEGAAGSGKTTSIGGLAYLYEKDGWDIIGTAQAWAAADILKRDMSHLNQLKCVSLRKLLSDLSRQQLNKKTCIIVDEAGLNDTNTIANLVYLANQSQFPVKFIFSGEEKQLTNISGGNALNLIKSINPEQGNSRIVNIFRQQDPLENQIVQLLRSKDSELALYLLSAIGKLHITDTQEEAMGLAAKQFVATANTEFQKTGSLKNVPLITFSRNKDIDEWNNALSSALFAQRRNPNIAQELKQIFNQPDDLTADEADTGLPQISLPIGGGEKMTLRKGQRIIFQKNLHKVAVFSQSEYGQMVQSGFLTNKTPAILEKIQFLNDEKNNAILAFSVSNLKNARFQIDTRSFFQDYAFMPIKEDWARSNFASQGQTAPNSSSFWGIHTDARAAYVSGSRHRENFEVFVSKEALHLPIDANNTDVLKTLSQQMKNSQYKHSLFVGSMQMVYDALMSQKDLILKNSNPILQQQNQEQAIKVIANAFNKHPIGILGFANAIKLAELQNDREKPHHTFEEWQQKIEAYKERHAPKYDAATWAQKMELPVEMAEHYGQFFKLNGNDPLSKHAPVSLVARDLDGIAQKYFTANMVHFKVNDDEKSVQTMPYFPFFVPPRPYQVPVYDFDNEDFSETETVIPPINHRVKSILLFQSFQDMMSHIRQGEHEQNELLILADERFFELGSKQKDIFKKINNGVLKENIFAIADKTLPEFEQEHFFEMVNEAPIYQNAPNNVDELFNDISETSRPSDEFFGFAFEDNSHFDEFQGGDEYDEPDDFIIPPLPNDDVPSFIAAGATDSSEVLSISHSPTSTILQPPIKQLVPQNIDMNFDDF